MSEGPHYGRRRLIAAGLIILIIALIAALLVSAGLWVRDTIRSQDAERQAAAAGTSYAMPEACQLPLLSTSVDAPVEARVGAGMTINLAIRNTGPDACILDVGSEQLSLIIGSGSALALNSAACPADPKSRPLLIDAGTVATLAIQWDGMVGTNACVTKGEQMAAESGMVMPSATESSSGESDEAASGEESTAPSDEPSAAATAKPRAQSTRPAPGSAAPTTSAAALTTSVSPLGTGLPLTRLSLPSSASRVTASAMIQAESGKASPSPSPAPTEFPAISVPIAGGGGYAQAGTYWMRIQLGGKDLIDMRPFVLR